MLIRLNRQRAHEQLERFRNCDDMDSGSSDEEINNQNENNEDHDEANEINHHVVETIKSLIRNANEFDENDPNLHEKHTFTLEKIQVLSVSVIVYTHT
ncbi:hypothetical protein BpHYR1_045721 [Brachionus plicatilis]|uniref:Uncharacterized protein n=1 Tax=Brachionus plicatilis TaxID=10195 RepID=A0A3M7QWQ9_BRAPC|nr:hypothetical protein BpHYR1_045721 [Brachionus plicatilis]